MTATSKQPRGIRNNNPLNLRKSNASWLGKIYPGQDPQFEQFTSMLMGIRAAIVNTRTIISRNPACTLEKYISVWAPASENNTRAYIDAVCRDALVSPRQVMDIKKKGMITRVLWAMAKVECGRTLPYELFTQAYEMLYPEG